MKQYLDTLYDVLTEGKEKGDRTGTGTYSLFGRQMRFDLSKGFPLLTTKKVNFKSVVAELLWFLSGSTNARDLNAMGCHIWDEWADKSGELGPIYGYQWRNWEGYEGVAIDQIAQLIDGIRQDPDSRRHIVNAWNVGDLKEMALTPCHALFQMDVTDGKLSCQVYQRSADLFLGVPFNIASYALLTHMVAEQCDLEVGDLIWTGGDCHIYKNHVYQVITQLSRKPYGLCEMIRTGDKPADIFSYRPESFQLMAYEHHPAIKAPIAV